MFSSALVALLSGIVVVRAQYGGDYGGGGSSPTTSASSAASVPSAPADTPGQHNVQVAAGGFVFSPAAISAKNGENVTFFFPSGLQHSVTQSSFEAPCTYLAATSNTSAGFDSGFASSAQFTITITDESKPIWFHCKQVGHCGQFGMVGSINAPTSGNTHDNFVAAAKAIGSSEQKEDDKGFIAGGVNAEAKNAPSSATGSSTPPPSGGMRLEISAAAVIAGGLVAMLL
ncbi:hypothetical protein MKEN_01187500 [Mycena kentingensis (nom. inval.)]|nr:hypothetical protein MKEN_01187500 [Mycena kentingensis (nom. inval.)]